MSAERRNKESCGVVLWWVNMNMILHLCMWMSVVSGKLSLSRKSRNCCLRQSERNVSPAGRYLAWCPPQSTRPKVCRCAHHQQKTHPLPTDDMHTLNTNIKICALCLSVWNTHITLYSVDQVIQILMFLQSCTLTKYSYWRMDWSFLELSHSSLPHT